MAGRNVSLASRLSDFVDHQVGSGRHQNASEVVREALRRYETALCDDAARILPVLTNDVAAPASETTQPRARIGNHEIRGWRRSTARSRQQYQPRKISASSSVSVQMRSPALEPLAHPSSAPYTKQMHIGAHSASQIALAIASGSAVPNGLLLLLRLSRP